MVVLVLLFVMLCFVLVGTVVVWFWFWFWFAVFCLVCGGWFDFVVGVRLFYLCLRYYNLFRVGFVGVLWVGVMLCCFVV